MERALLSPSGCAVGRVSGYRCTDDRLQGHAFKYAGHEAQLTGVYPYRIDYVDDTGRPFSLEAMVKAKPSERAVMAVYSGLLSRCGISVGQPLSTILSRSDYSVPNVKEATLFRDHASDLSPYLPRSLGVFIDERCGYTLRVEERLPAGSVIAEPDDDTTRHWRPGFPELVVDSLADIHSRFYGRTEGLLGTGRFFAHTSAVMLRGTELWQAFLSFLTRTYGSFVDGHPGRRHRHLIETLPEWYELVDQAPMTLLYGDVNPQNLAFSPGTSGSFVLSLFDWERAVVSLPHRDLAELLVYLLDPVCEREQVDTLVSRYRRALVRATGQDLDEGAFIESLRWMLGDLIVNRLPLMMIVAHATGKRPNSVTAYATAHRLLDLLE